MSILTIVIYTNIKCKAPRKRITYGGPRESNDCLPDHAVCAERVEQRIRSSGSVWLRTHRRRDHVQRNPCREHGIDDGLRVALVSRFRFAENRRDHVRLVLVEPVGIDSDVVPNHAKRVQHGVEITLHVIGNRVEDLRVRLEIMEDARENHSHAIDHRSDHARIVAVHRSIGARVAGVVGALERIRSLREKIANLLRKIVVVGLGNAVQLVREIVVVVAHVVVLFALT